MVKMSGPKSYGQMLPLCHMCPLRGIQSRQELLIVKVKLVITSMMMKNDIAIKEIATVRQSKILIK